MTNETKIYEDNSRTLVGKKLNDRRQTMKITLHNEFHNTTATLIPRNGLITPRQLARAENSLCSQSTCCCGGLAAADKDMYEHLWFTRQYGPNTEQRNRPYRIR